MNLGVARYSSQLYKLLHVAGGETQELDEVLQGVFVLENDRIEWDYLRGDRICSADARQTASAALRSTVRLRNPENSGILVVLEQIDYDSDIGDTIIAQLHGTTAELAGAARRGVCIDGRFGFNQESAGLLSRDNLAPAGTVSFWRSATVAGVPNVWAPPRGIAILPPGLGIDFASNGNNVALRVSMRWRERARDRFEI